MNNFKYIKKFKKSGFIQYSPKQNYILNISGNQIIVTDAKTLDKVHIFKTIKYPGQVTFSFGDIDMIASGSTMKKLAVFNLEDMSVISTYRITKLDEPQDCNIYFSPDNKKIICGIYEFNNSKISVLDLESSKIEDIKIVDDSIIKKIEYCISDNSYLFYIFQRRGYIINGEEYSKTYILKWKYPFEVNEPIKIETDILLTWSDISYNHYVSQYALYDSRNKALVITDETLNKELKRYVVPDRRIGYFNILKWSLDGKHIVLVFLKSVKLIRVSDMQCVKEFKVSFGFYSEFSPDGKLLLIGTMSSGYLVDINEVL
ncbi:hypothetical protein SH2C18_03920 [Clostridium sediminicola]|uniref:YncE family protein n=1 Tax=Clostridium sediminicola TaxID=3114879 RepID=UPI0031F1FE04